MKARFFSFAASLSPVFLLALCFAYPVAAENSPSSAVLKIGFVLPLSGEWAFLGNGIRDAALLAKEDLAGQGRTIEFVFEDNRGDLKSSAAAGAKLASSDKVSAMISIISGVGMLLKPIAAREGILNIGICSEPEVADGRFSFINYLTAQQGVSKYIHEFERTAGTRGSIGILSLNESGFQRIVKELDWQGGDDIDLRFSETFNAGTTDFRTLLGRAAARKPDALLLLGLSPEIELIAKQARELKLSIPLTSIESFGLAKDPSAFEGSWFVDSAVPNAEFQARFKSAYGKEVTPGTGHAYDTVMMLAKAFQGNAGLEAARKKFRAIKDFPGVIGPLDVHPDGIVWSEASVKLIQNGHATVPHR